MLIETPQLGRRRFLIGGIAAVGALISASKVAAQSATSAPLPTTPAQTAGPFYPLKFPSDVDNDLVVLRGSAARAEGIVTHIAGRVLGRDGRPLARARVEIWQCDVHGRYLHPGSGGLRDRAFQGFGRAVSTADGSYSFRTIRPAAYSGRTPHIHFAVRAAGKRELITQMYVAGDPKNEADFLYRSLGARRDAVTVRLQAANGVEEGALAGQFDIVLG